RSMAIWGALPQNLPLFRPRSARPQRPGSRKSTRRSRRSRQRVALPRARSARSPRRRHDRIVRMIRVIVFLAAAGFIALGVVWLAARPGQIAITWLGYRTDTSVMVAISAIVAFAILAVMLWSLVRFLLRSPKLFS